MNKNSFAKLHIDKTKREALVKELSTLGKEQITAGIHKAEGKQVVSESGFKVIDVAVQNEFGNEFAMPRTVKFQKNGKWFIIKQGTKIKIPETRFIGRLVQNYSERSFLIDVVKAELHLVFKGYQFAHEAIRNIGIFMRDRIRGYIDNKEFQSNSPMTIEAKGFDQRLFEKGTLYKSIRYRTRTKQQND